MFAGEVNPPFRHDRCGKITEPDKGPRAARPLVFSPALRHTTFEVSTQSGEDSVELLQRRLDTAVLFHACDPLGFTRPRVSHQDPAWSRLAPRRLPDLNPARCERKAVQSLSFPKPIACLQINARHRVVVSTFDRIALSRRECGQFHLSQDGKRNRAEHAVANKRFRLSGFQANYSRRARILFDTN